MAGAVAMLLLAFAVRSSAQGRYDPRLQFHVVSTARFDILYHQGEEALAARLAQLVEPVAAEIDARLGAPRGRVTIVLVDQTDQANGWATVVPYNLIELTAVPPASYSVIGNTGDWLRLVFAHEYTHVVHLDRSGGWLGSIGRVFGRNPFFYPNLFVPRWQIEGLATYEESVVTSGGRVPAADFRAMLDHAATAGRFAPLDRASGDAPDWPSGHAAYLYGAYFHEYLATRFGAASLTRLADDTARRLPLFGSRAFSAVFGRALGELWSDFERDTRLRLTEPGPAAERLTHQGFHVSAPAFSAGGRLFYSVSTPHDFPALMELPAGGGPPMRLTSRYGGARLAIAGETIVFDQLELVRNTALLSDIYATSIRDGSTRRLTRDARAGDPDVSPDGRTVVCTLQQAGRRILATFELPPRGALADPRPLVSELETEFSTPRWSPDGRLLTAERRRLNGPSEIVVVDASTGRVTPLVSQPGARHMTPAWLPDGRGILFASDRGFDGFRIYAVDRATHTVVRVPGVRGDARFPALSPDGRRLVVVGLSADGYDLYQSPFDPTTVLAAPAASPRIDSDSPAASATEAPAPQSSAEALESRPYAPWSTLAPRLWLPVLDVNDDEWQAGGATTGFDALGRHTYWAAAGWSSRSRPWVQLDYAYTRWRPSLFVSWSDETEAWRAGDVRSREAGAGVLFPVRRVRWTTTLLAAVHASDEAFDCHACPDPVDVVRERRALRLGWQASTMRSFGYSISPERGVFAAVTTELTRRALGASGNANTVIADVRGYLPVRPRHGVLAMRLAGAVSRGSDAVRRGFSAGGSGPRPAGFVFDSDAIGLMRGFSTADLSGDSVAVANIDYRVPLIGVQRGAGTFPVFLRQIHGAVFMDAGSAWQSRGTRASWRQSFGAELSADVLLGGALPVTLTGGLALRDEPAADDGRAWVAFWRLGRGF